MENKITRRQHIDFFNHPQAIGDVLTVLHIPPRLQKKKILIHDFEGLSKEEVKDRLKSIYLGAGRFRFDPCIGFQIYGNLKCLYVFFFSEDNRCVITYFFNGWITHKTLGHIESLFLKIKKRILFAIGKTILWLFGKKTK